MDILAFDIKGKFAHFRKYYSNSTALSYFIPPRTTIAGIIAAILGMERDSYYEKFSMKNCKIGVKVNNKIKKANHCINYLKVESKSDLNGSKGRTQIPFEVVMPENLREKGDKANEGYVSYRVYYSGEKANMDELREKLEKGEYNPITLGTASFNAFIENYKHYDNIQPQQTNGNHVLISSVIPNSEKKKVDIYSKALKEKIMLLTEIIPYQFNDNRELTAHGEVLFTIDSQPIPVKLNNLDYYTLDKENVVFLE